MMYNRDGRIEYRWSRNAYNIINACNFIFKEFSKIDHIENFTCLVK